jgi:glycosyltransferase involved in cell wall biosynthesis
MRILHILGNRKLPQDPDHEATSGVVRAALELARHQQDLGHEPWVVVVGPTGWESIWKGVRLLAVPSMTNAQLKLGKRQLDLSMQLPLMLLTARYNFDVIHAHLYSYLRFLRARLRVIHFHVDPLYVSPHGPSAAYSPADFKTITRYSDVQIAVSQYVATQIRHGTQGRENLHVVYNGVDSERFDPQRNANHRTTLRREWAVREDETILLFAGALIPEKGVIHLAHAFERLRQLQPNVRLVVAGGGSLWGGTKDGINNQSSYERQIADALQEAWFSGQVSLLGKMGTEQMQHVYAASDVVVVPSVWPEPCPLVILEAMAAGRPVVASNAGGIGELINQYGGLLVEPQDEDALTDTLYNIVADMQLQKTLGAQSAAAMQTNSWLSVAQQVGKIYEAYI